MSGRVWKKDRSPRSALTAVMTKTPTANPMEVIHPFPSEATRVPLPLTENSSDASRSGRLSTVPLWTMEIVIPFMGTLCFTKYFRCIAWLFLDHCRFVQRTVWHRVGGVIVACLLGLLSWSWIIGAKLRPTPKSI